MTTFAVRYTYDERADVRDTVRPEHRAWLAQQAEAGVLLGSGPFVDGDPGALLVLRADDEPALRALLTQDPFAREGLLAAVDVRAWDVVLGPWAASV
ncbi:YciI family protein [Cellulomonas sp. B6]|uniref:YciI family protein n=1 Tax=Cellulomonas sp. B6 TaxID=1295626 RepID=UPI00073C584E|nr:YciI family protein [Cellulomonas sp. B6]KSW21873.1 hypothetical protein ATM99_13260 [Cellulomonas sp. B6]